jgi:predicted RNase H-like HicB family nuclease
MFTKYFEAAMRLAQYELMEDGRYWGEIPGFVGVWACEQTLEDCRNELKSTLEDWVMVKLWDLDDDIPSLGRLSLLPKNPAKHRHGSGLKTRARKAS